MLKRIVSVLLLATMLMLCFGGYAVDMQKVGSADDIVPSEIDIMAEEPEPDFEEEENIKVELLNASPLDDAVSAGQNISWTVLNGMLIVTGTGDGVIEDFSEGGAPWYEHKDGINFIYISGIKTVGSYAFYGLDKATGIYFTDTISEINEGAFKQCSSIPSFDLPKGLTKIGANAFNGCEKIPEFVISASVTEIGEDAFFDCRSLTHIDVADGNAVYSSEAGVLFNKDKTELIKYPSANNETKYTVPSEIINICDYAFAEAAILTEIKLNDKLEKIGEGAFYNCSSVTSFNITKKVCEIGRNAFQGCDSVEKYTVNSANDNYKANSYVLMNKSGDELVRFPSNGSGGRLAPKYDIPTTVTTIKEGAFEGARNLITVNFNSNIKKIESFAFDNAQSIEKITYPGSRQQWGLIDIGDFVGINEAQIEYGENVRSYTIVIGESYNLMDYLDESEREQLANAEKIEVTASNPNIVVIDVENTTVTAAAVGETLVTASATVDGATKKAAVLIKVTDNPEAAGVNLEFTVGDSSVDLKKMAEVAGFESFWDRFTWVSTDISVATVRNGVVTPVGPGEATILAKLGDDSDKKAITCKVVVNENKIDYYQFFDFDKATGTIKKYIGGLDDSNLIIPAAIDGVSVVAIDSYAFSNTDVRKITLCNGIKSVGDYAFADAAVVSSIILPKGLEKIGNYAFSNCNSLRNITIPSTVSVSQSGSNWFYGTKIKGVTFSNGMEYIGDSWLRNSTVQNVTLPSTLTKVPEYVFYNCTNLKSVKIPDSVTEIGDYAFYRCALESLDLNKTQKIGYRAFSYNSSLRNLNLGTALTESASNSFEGNTALTEVTIPQTLKTVASYMFADCYNINKVTFESGVETIDTYAFENCCISELNIPETVKSISACAFLNNMNMSQVSLGMNLKSIGAYAFSGCSSLEKFEIPDSVTFIGNGVFKYCSGLSEITIGSGIKKVPNSLFSGCDSVRKITLNSGITSVGNYAFRDCVALEEISIPDTVKTIGGYAFYGCVNIKEISLGSNTDYVGSYAFNKCTGLESVTIASGKIYEYAFANCTKLATVVLGDDVTYIYNRAFNGCGELSNLTIGRGVAHIAEYAFAYCSSLENITFEDGDTGSCLSDIGSYAFYQCVALKKVVLPDSLRSIGSYAFDGCSNLIELDLGSGLEVISDYAFYCCSKIKELTFPDSLKSIGRYGFGYCTELEILNNLAPNVSIGYNAFWQCKFMTISVINADETSYKALDQDIAGYIPLELNYKINDNTNISDVTVRITLPSSVSILAGSCKIDGKVSSDFTEKDASYGTYLTIPVTNKSGKIAFTIKPEAWDSISSTASLECKMYGNSRTYTIGTVNCSLPEITASTVDVTSGDSVIVEGMTRRYSYVKLYVDGAYQKDVYSNSYGNYKTSVSLPNTEDGRIYTITAEAANGATASATVAYQGDVPNLESLVMYYGKDGYMPSKYNLTTSQRLNIRWGDFWYGKGRGYSYRFEVDLSNAENVDKVYVVSVRNNEKSYLEAVWDGEHYVTKGHFKNDCEYVIGTLSVEYTKKVNDVKIPSPSDTVAYFDIDGSRLLPAINEFNNDIYNATVVVEEELKDKFGDTASVNVQTEDIEITEDVLDKLNSLKYSYDTEIDGCEYTLAIDDTMPDNFMLLLLNKSERNVTIYNISFTRYDEDGLSDVVFIEDVLKSVGEVSHKYEALFGIDISEDKLEEGMAMLSLSMDTETKVSEAFEKFKAKKNAFLLSSLILSAASMGDISPDRTVCKVLSELMKTELDYFRELKLANIYKVSPDYSIRWFIDPSGYVYEGVKGNRLEGVTATIYKKDENGNPVQWVDEDTGQPNPVKTDEAGKYKWDVTEGQWQVKFEKEGYKTVITEWMDAPPPQTDVNVELEPDVTAVSAPEVKITTEGIVITYKDYMDPQSVIENVSIEGMTKSDYTISYNEGAELLAEGFENKDLSGKEYAKTYTLTFNNELNAGESKTVSIGSAQSHIDNVSSGAYEATLQTEEPDIKEVTLLNKTLDEEDNSILLLDYINNTGKVIDICNIMVAVYDEKNHLISAKPYEINNFNPYENADTLRAELPDGWKNVKLFAWDNEHKPLGRVESFSK